MADSKLLIEYALDDFGRIKSYHVLDKMPDVSYNDIASVTKHEKTAREVAADLNKLGKLVVDVESYTGHVPVFGVRSDGSPAEWDYKSFPMGVIVSSSVKARVQAAKSIVESADHAKTMWAGNGEEKSMLAEVHSMMMSRYDEMADERVNNWENVSKHVAEPIIAVVDVDKFTFQPDVDSLIGSIARLGKAADVHLLLLLSTTARMPGELKENIGFRLLLGKSTATESIMLFTDTVGTLLPDDPSYGVLKIGDDEAVIRLLESWPIIAVRNDAR